jgi:hypothetical protein
MWLRAPRKRTHKKRQQRTPCYHLVKKTTTKRRATGLNGTHAVVAASHGPWGARDGEVLAYRMSQVQRRLAACDNMRLAKFAAKEEEQEAVASSQPATGSSRSAVLVVPLASSVLRSRFSVCRRCRLPFAFAFAFARATCAPASS